MLTLYLPLKPKLKEADHAIALATYYQQFPSIFGIASGGGGTPRGMSLITSASLDIGPVGRPGPTISEFLASSSPIRFAGRNPPPGGFMPNGGTFLDFQVVLLAAMAKAWDSESFADLLRADDGTTLPALGTIRGFTPQWRLLLQVKDDTEAEWDGEKWTVTPHVLTLNLPKTPVLRDQGIALAAYNSTGAEYPFTCCA